MRYLHVQGGLSWFIPVPLYKIGECLLEPLLLPRRDSEVVQKAQFLLQMFAKRKRHTSLTDSFARGSYTIEICRLQNVNGISSDIDSPSPTKPWIIGKIGDGYFFRNAGV